MTYSSPLKALFKINYLIKKSGYGISLSLVLLFFNNSLDLQLTSSNFYSKNFCTDC